MKEIKNKTQYLSVDLSDVKLKNKAVEKQNS